MDFKRRMNTEGSANTFKNDLVIRIMLVEPRFLKIRSIIDHFCKYITMVLLSIESFIL